MPVSEKLTTVVSTKGQVILPKAIRAHKNWKAGTRLVVQETEDKVLLKAAPIFPATKSEDVFGSLAYQGSTRTIEEMDAAVATEVQRRHGLNRY